MRFESDGCGEQDGDGEKSGWMNHAAGHAASLFDKWWGRIAFVRDSN